MFYYPIMLNIKSKKILIIGSGKVAERKLKSLIGKGADITVISTEISDKIRSFSKIQEIKLIERQVDSDMMDFISSFYLVILATDDRSLQDYISERLNEKSILYLRADDKDSSFISPSSIEMENLCISISTYGKNPGSSIYLKNLIQEKLDLDNINRKIGLLSEIRDLIKLNYDEISDRKKLLSEIQDYSIDELYDYLSTLRNRKA
ncbi:MAG: bifunctional precorrin-2 dehydrogenase/sirohydrochlorin ferrochelatase [Tissierellia bacterium]|nr:bifunctional precorrin-2 dehydrogenase/sirohydrochlorin ferrochelatase [Tissierellia bacterium]